MRISRLSVCNHVRAHQYPGSGVGHRGVIDGNDRVAQNPVGGHTSQSNDAGGGLFHRPDDVGRQRCLNCRFRALGVSRSDAGIAQCEIGNPDLRRIVGDGVFLPIPRNGHRGRGIVLALNLDVVVPFIEHLFGVHFLAKDVYYISELPSDLRYHEVFVVTGISFLISLLATLYPSYRASQTQPAEALRYE